MLNVQNENNAVIEVYGGYPVKQHFNEKTGRWYVWLPKHCGLRELWNRNRIQRSHYVFMRCFGINKVPKSRVIHHKDHNRENDNYDNLELLTVGAHNAYHEEDARLNPRQGPFMGRKHSEETLLRMSDGAKVRGNNDIWGGAKKEHFYSTKLLMGESAAGERNTMYRHDLDDEAIRRCFQSTSSLSITARIFGCSVQCVRNRVENKTSSAEWKMLTNDELLAAFNKSGKNLHKTALALNAPDTSLRRKLKKIGAIDA